MLNKACFAILPLLLAFQHAIAPAAQDQGFGGPGQARLAQEVRHQLLMLPYYNVFDNLEFRVEGRDVVLTGQVTRPVVKEDAESAVRSIPGVETVTNDIEVLPVSPFDDQIRRAAYRAIYGNPALRRYALNPNPPIRIIVKNGNITLAGVVDSEIDKTLAGMQANSVPDVFSVTNNLRVEG